MHNAFIDESNHLMKALRLILVTDEKRFYLKESKDAVLCSKINTSAKITLAKRPLFF